MILGIDASSYLDVLRRGAVFPEGEPLDAMRQNGVDTLRIRLWVNPVAPDGQPYLGGDCDLENFLSLGALAAQKGYKLLLDLHYSDFWADPGKQFLPKAWVGLSESALIEQVYRYTCTVLSAIRAAKLPLALIQVGNEITNGFLWPLGQLRAGAAGRENYPALIRLLNAGIRACRELAPQAQIILHLERSNDWPVYEEFFTHMARAQVDYDVIGASYYPYWHGSFDDFFHTMEQCRIFGKRRMVMETSYAFTLEDYLPAGDGLVVCPARPQNVPKPPPYPFTEEGQAAYVREFLRRCRETGLDGVFYWEPFWLPGEGSCWASASGQAYIQETGKPTRNEWANQGLLDYQGRRLKAFYAFRKQ